jgi:hypothetical protein
MRFVGRRELSELNGAPSKHDSQAKITNAHSRPLQHRAVLAAVNLE